MQTLAEQFGADRLIVVLGLNEVDTLRIMATTFKDGDPSYAGPLAGVALGLRSYHIFELKNEVPEDVWASEMAMNELEVEDEQAGQLVAVLRQIRGDDTE